MAACACSSSSDHSGPAPLPSPAPGIKKSLERVEQLLPNGSKRIGTRSGTNYQIDTYALPIPVAHFAATLPSIEHDPRLAEAPLNVRGTWGFAFRGDSTCDGTYDIDVQWSPSEPTTAHLSGHCED